MTTELMNQRLGIIAKYSVEDMHNVAKKIQLMIELEDIDEEYMSQVEDLDDLPLEDAYELYKRQEVRDLNAK